MQPKQYAFLLMGESFAPAVHRVRFEAGGCVSHIRTVRGPDEARACVRELAAQGVGAIELCGAFGPELACELIEVAGGKVAVGYVVHEPEQDALFSAFFGD